VISILNHDCDTAIELHRILSVSITRALSLDETAASVLADRLALHVRHELGGEQIYIPTMTLHDRSVRNAQIRRDFNGRNARELGRLHGLSRSSIYRIASGK